MPSPTKRAHIYAIDFVRCCVVLAVITNHVISQVSSSVFIGAIWTVTHLGREIFILLSAFVLTYVYALRPNLNWPQFFRRRYLLVGVPYVVWTVIYTLADGHGVPTHNFLENVGIYLINGRARYHLYFLLVSMQLYLFFPGLKWLLKATQRHHLKLLVASAILQTIFTGLVQWSVGQSGPLGFWLGNPDIWLASYQFYILAGSVAAWHLPELVEYVDRHRRRWIGLALASLVVAEAIYGVTVATGASVEVASTTFQPIVTLQAVAFAMMLFALGRRWELSGARGKLWVRRAANATFGVYLVHPLILQGLVGLMAVSGIAALSTHLPAAVVVILLLIFGVPVVALLSLLLHEIARRTPLCLPLTGRLREPTPPRPVAAKPTAGAD
jgi:peptidoglycan/LPS O-acetylase OafA/YrhL